VEFALAALKIALNQWNLVLLICGLDCSAYLARASFRLNLNYFNHGVQKKSATSASSSELRGALSPRRAKSVPASFVASSSSRKPLYANIVLFHTQKQLLPNPMVIRLVSVSDQMPLHEFHDVFRTILGWNGDLGYIVRVHGQEI